MARVPRWFPGYTVAAVSTIAYFATAPGQTMIVSLFNTSLRGAFGNDDLKLNSAYTLATVLASLPLVLAGTITDRFGPRRTMAAIAFLFGLSCMFMGLARGSITVFLAFFLLRFLGQGSLSLVSNHAVAMWFHRRLGSVTGIKLVVVFGLWAGLPTLVVWMIESLGWRQTYAALGVAVWVLVIPAALLFVRNRPEDIGLQIDDDGRPSRATGRATSPAPRPEPSFTLREALRTRAYWVLAAATFLPPLIGTAMLFDMQPILAERGMGASVGAIAVSVWSITMATMAIPAGILTDRVRPAVLIAVGLSLTVVSAALLAVASGPGLVYACMVSFGVGQSIGASSAAATVARYFGRLHHGAIRSSLTRIGVFGTGIGPLMTGLSAKFTGAYDAALWGFAISCLPVIALCTLLSQPRPPTLDPDGSGPVNR